MVGGSLSRASHARRTQSVDATSCVIEFGRLVCSDSLWQRQSPVDFFSISEPVTKWQLDATVLQGDLHNARKLRLGVVRAMQRRCPTGIGRHLVWSADGCIKLMHVWQSTDQGPARKRHPFRHMKRVSSRSSQTCDDGLKLIYLLVQLLKWTTLCPLYCRWLFSPWALCVART